MSTNQAPVVLPVQTSMVARVTGKVELRLAVLLKTLDNSRAMRPCLLGQRSLLKLARPSVPMTTAADDEMRKYWEKNQQLGRPNSPWLIYRWPVTMASSFAHRVTGVGLGLALYSASIGMAVAPGDFAVYLDYLKALELGPAVWFPIKIFCSFPIFYHCLSGIRHLYWDFKGGYEMQAQTKSAYLIWGTAIVAAITVASASYVI